MFKESLFELIRKEEVVIWAGSGLSLYAGFPSGKGLGEILINSLSIPEREAINENLPLPDLAEEFYRLKGNSRNTLIRTLRDTFSKVKPQATHCHDNLALIPHFKTIITTNYDSMIEDALKEKSQVVLSKDDIPYLAKGKTQVFKVHGDLSSPDSIIITNSDYNNFFKSNSESNLYWTVIKERLSTNNILFLGYNLEDPNVSVIFDKITDALGTNRKECFFIAPGLKAHKVNDLVKKQIHYIDMYAEDFLSDLIQNIKENIIGDLENGNTSADTFRNFLSNLNLLPSLKAEDKNFKLQGIDSISKNIEGKLQFTIKPDQKLLDEFNEFVAGKKVGTFTICEDKLNKVNLWYGGLKIPDEGIGKLEIRSVAKKEGFLDIRFDNGTEVNGIQYKLFGLKSGGEIHLEFKKSEFILNVNAENMPRTDFKFTFSHNKICENVKDEIELYTLLTTLYVGEGFTIFSNDGKQFEYKFPQIPNALDKMQNYLLYFKGLKEIELYYKFRFSNFDYDSITDKTYFEVEEILAFIKNEPIEEDWDGELTFEIFDDSEQTIQQLLKLSEENSTVVAFHKDEEEIELHGHKLNIGLKKVEFIEPYVTNLQSILEQGDKNVKIKSKVGKKRISYLKKSE